MHSLPSVRELALIEVPDEECGEAVPAVVTLEDAKMAKEDEIVTLCREHIANYKLSHQVAFFDALALSGASMIMKSVLRDSYRKIQKR